MKMQFRLRLFSCQVLVAKFSSFYLPFLGFLNVLRDCLLSCFQEQDKGNQNKTKCWFTMRFSCFFFNFFSVAVMKIGKVSKTFPIKFVNTIMVFCIHQDTKICLPAKNFCDHFHIVCLHLHRYLKKQFAWHLSLQQHLFSYKKSRYIGLNI